MGLTIPEEILKLEEEEGGLRTTGYAKRLPEVKISDSTRLYYSGKGFKPLKGMSEEEIIINSEYISSACARPGDLEKDILKRIETEAASVLNCEVHPPDLNGMRKAAGLEIEEFKATHMDIEGKRRLMVEVKIEYKKNGNGVYDTIIKLPDENLIRGLVKNNGVYDTIIKLPDENLIRGLVKNER